MVICKHFRKVKLQIWVFNNKVCTYTGEECIFRRIRSEKAALACFLKKITALKNKL